MAVADCTAGLPALMPFPLPPLPHPLPHPPATLGGPTDPPLLTAPLAPTCADDGAAAPSADALGGGGRGGPAAAAPLDVAVDVVRAFGADLDRRPSCAPPALALAIARRALETAWSKSSRRTSRTPRGSGAPPIPAIAYPRGPLQAGPTPTAPIAPRPAREEAPERPCAALPPLDTRVVAEPAWWLRRIAVEGTLGRPPERLLRPRVPGGAHSAQPPHGGTPLPSAGAEATPAALGALAAPLAGAASAWAAADAETDGAAEVPLAALAATALVVSCCSSSCSLEAIRVVSDMSSDSTRSMSVRDIGLACWRSWSFCDLRRSMMSFCHESASACSASDVASAPAVWWCSPALVRTISR